MGDDFEKAILFSFDQTGAVNAELRARALEFMRQAKESPEIWRLCLERFTTSQHPEVQFWCLQALEEVVRQRYAAFSPEDRSSLRTALLVAVCQGSSRQPPAGPTEGMAAPPTMPVFVRNKLAQVVVLLICIDYPASWPNVFVDMLGSLGRGPSVVDMFLRVLLSLDEEVISLDYPRAPEEGAIAGRVKDGMRAQCIGQVVEAWYALAAVYAQADPDLTAFVLETAQRYVAWIDIGLVASKRFLDLLFGFLAASQEPDRLRAAAANTLRAIVNKRMDPAAKLAMLQGLPVGELVAGTIGNSALKDQSPDVFARVSQLLVGLATELLEVGKKLESANGSVEGGAAAAWALLDAVLPAVLYFAKHAEEEDLASTTKFLLAYVAKIKSGSEIRPAEGEQLRQILELVRERMKYAADVRDSLEVPDALGVEEEERMAEFRRDLFTLLRNTARVAPAVARSFVGASLAAVLSGQGGGRGGEAPPEPEDVEAAIMLVYQLGEGAPEEAFKAGPQGFSDIVLPLLSATVPHHRHRIVALVVLDTAVRYVRLVVQQPEFIAPVLSLFLDARGLRHPSPGVASRAAYLLMRLVKALRPQLKPLTDVVLQGLREALATVGVVGGKLRANGVSVKDNTTGADDRLYIFEAVGLLVGSDELSVEQQAKYLSAFLGPLCQQVERILQDDIPAGDTVGPPAAADALHQHILAIQNLSKGFGEQLAKEGRALVADMFKQAVEEALRVLAVLPKNKPLRARVTSFLHRMVESLGSSIFVFLPAALQQLLAESEPADTVDFIMLVNQLVNKFKGQVLPLVNELLPAVVGRVGALVPTNLPTGPGSNTEVVRELRELQRVYFTLLQTVVVCGLTDVLLSPRNLPLLDHITGALLTAAEAHPEVLVRKVCVQVLAKLVAEWCGNGTQQPEKVPGFRRFVIERFASECCVVSMFKGGFDIYDANTNALLGEMVSTQKLVYERCADEFLVHLAGVVLPALHCPHNLIEEYCLHLQRSPVKDLRVFVRTLVERLAPIQNGNGHLR